MASVKKIGNVGRIQCSACLCREKISVDVVSLLGKNGHLAKRGLDKWRCLVPSLPLSSALLVPQAVGFG